MRIQNALRSRLRAQLLRRSARGSGACRRAVRWQADGDMIRNAYTLREEDDDWGQAGTLVREVLDDDARDRLVQQHCWAHNRKGVKDRFCQRVFEYWRNVDPDLGKKVEEGVRAGSAS